LKLFWLALSGFLLLFAIDSGLGLIDETIHLFTGFHPLRVFRIISSSLVLLAAPFAWLAMVISPRVPKLVYAPIVLLMAWFTLGILPLPIYLDLSKLGLVAAVLQVLVAAIALGQAWTHTDTSLRYTDTFRNHRPFFSWINALGVAGATLILGPPTVAVYAFVNADLACKVYSGDFIRLNVNGFEIAHKQYTRGDKTLDLIGMSHIGDPRIYDILFDDIPPSDQTLLLEEGVSDSEGHLGAGPMYDKMAARVGLTTQKSMSEMTNLKIRNADVDVKEFSKETLELLGYVMAIYRADDPLPPLVEYILYAQGHDDPEALGHQLHDDLVTRRNDVLLEHIDGAFKDHQRVIVPWGAYHMKGVEEAVLADGFTKIGDVRHTLVPFAPLFGFN
jgi:hypothetical protein